MKTGSVVKQALLWILAGVLAGCAVKAKPAPPAGFIPAELLSKNKQLPFHKAWLNPEVDWAGYTKIRFADVNTDPLAQMDWWKRLERRGSFEADLRNLAGYTKTIFTRAFREDPDRRFEVVEEAAAGTLLFEIALVEVIPSKVVLNTLGYAPFVGSAFRMLRNTRGKSTVAFEARVRDAATGGVIALFADREWEKTTPLNVKDVTWYGHAESIIAEWAYQFVRVFKRKPGETIPDSKPFHLKPW